MTTGSTTGNSEVLSYNLWWDDGSGTVNIDLIDELITSYIVEGLSGGEEYKFQVRARNIYGYGPLSDVLTVITKDIPD